MGKKLLLTVMALAAAIVLMAHGQSDAMDVGVGAAAWYADWEMYGGGMNEGFKPSFLYGGILSLGFAGDWSLSTVFLYGRFEPKSEGGPEYIERYDSDTSLNYNVFRYLKIIAGVKYMGYYWDEVYSEGQHYSVGPALGFGLTVPLVWNFYFICNVTGMYTFGRHNSQSSQGDRTTLMQEYGVNSTVGLVYYIEAISTTVTVGCRTQFFRYDPESEYEQVSDFLFWGAYASVVYSFGLFE